MFDMTMKRTRQPWMDADTFGRSLPRGIGVNLLVADMEAMVGFCRDVLAATVVYADEDFAAIELLGSTMMLHADHSYDGHEMKGALPPSGEPRGGGVEFRLYGGDPDAMEARARRYGAIVLSGAVDKPHGLREAHIVSPEGHVFVPSSPTKPGPHQP
jgi:predicted enzyme related to lactoylglutathione lyase